MDDIYGTILPLFTDNIGNEIMETFFKIKSWNDFSNLNKEINDELSLDLLSLSFEKVKTLKTEWEEIAYLSSNLFINYDFFKQFQFESRFETNNYELNLRKLGFIKKERFWCSIKRPDRQNVIENVFYSFIFQFLYQLKFRQLDENLSTKENINKIEESLKENILLKEQTRTNDIQFEKIACTKCTFLNNKNDKICEICLHPLFKSLINDNNDNLWICSGCTLKNPNCNQNCEACNKFKISIPNLILSSIKEKNFSNPTNLNQESQIVDISNQRTLLSCTCKTCAYEINSSNTATGCKCIPSVTLRPMKKISRNHTSSNSFEDSGHWSLNNWKCDICKKENELYKCQHCGLLDDNLLDKLRNSVKWHHEISLDDSMNQWECEKCSSPNDILAKKCNKCKNNNNYLEKCSKCKSLSINTKYNNSCSKCTKNINKLSLFKKQTDPGTNCNDVELVKDNTMQKVKRKKSKDIIIKKCLNCNELIYNNYDTWCQQCEVDRWFCNNSNCRGINFSKFEHCRFCKIKKDSNLSNCNNVFVHENQKEKLMWQCGYCLQLTNAKMTKCDHCQNYKNGISYTKCFCRWNNDKKNNKCYKCQRQLQ